MNNRTLKHSTEEIIVKFKEMHGDVYSYDKVNYVGYHSKVTITCSTHGDFEQRVSDHLANKGCNLCKHKKVADLQRGSVESFTLKAHAKFEGKFDYSKVVYTTARKNVTIVCPEHGEFEQAPDTHLRSVYGCLKCSQATLGKNSRSNTSAFIEKAKKVHKDKYDYSKSVYTTAIYPIEVVCNTCNNTFTVTPNIHLSGCGCTYCCNKGFDKSKPAMLYYLKVAGGQAYKIGITNYSVQKRFTVADLKLIEIIKTWEYAVGGDAYKAEQYYLREYKEYKYLGDPLLSSGNTELFYSDVLSLDT